MSSVRYAPAILVGRIVRSVARWRKPGGGSAIPGLVVNRIAPQFLATTLNGFPLGLVIVTGSSGKSTSTKMLVAMLRGHGLTVFTNESTANISQGLTSALLEQVSLTGRIAGDVAVLEVDEGHGALIASSLAPRIVALTNVMVDQIDRFHDSEMVATLLAKIAQRATHTVVLNADDRYLAELGMALEETVSVERYGVTGAVLAQNPRGLGYAETTSTRLPAGTGMQLVALEGRVGDVHIGNDSHSIRLPARGIHYAVDALTALSTARATLGERFDPTTACTALSTMPAVFGRGEVVVVRGIELEFVLVQNPSSFQLNIDSLEADTEQILMIIGSDVRDPSYFWPVDTSSLGHVNIASGLKAYDIALQLAYDDVQLDRIEPDVPTAIDAFMSLPTPTAGVKTIIFSADGMRRTRAHLGLVSNSEEPV